MARRPIIGITNNFGFTHDTDPPREQAYLLADYADAAYAAGGMPFPLHVLKEYDKQVLDELLDDIDGLMLTGGFDLDPSNFHQAVHPQTEPMHPRRDKFEMDLFRRADARRTPLLAICLGFQVAHVARGGQLAQHVDDLPLDPPITHHLPRDANAFHTVDIEPNSTLARIVGETQIEVTSRHHQIVPRDAQGAGLRPVAWAPDGVVEASEDCDGRFLLAVQWHPETIYRRPEQLRLFEAFVAAARNSP